MTACRRPRELEIMDLFMHTLIKISKNSIQEYLPLISGRSGEFKLNEEEYFNFSDNLALHELESPSFQ